MERKTKVEAETGKQDLVITREFDLPVALLFKAYEDAEIVAQWMGTKVLKLDNRNHGGYAFETSDPRGNVMFRANGAIHEFVPNQRITRTFEMENGPYGITIEYLTFEPLSEDKSKLTMHVVYKSPAMRDENLKLPFSYGINRAHDRLQEVVANLKTTTHEQAK